LRRHGGVKRSLHTEPRIAMGNGLSEAARKSSRRGTRRRHPTADEGGLGKSCLEHAPPQENSPVRGGGSFGARGLTKKGQVIGTGKIGIGRVESLRGTVHLHRKIRESTRRVRNPRTSNTTTGLRSCPLAVWKGTQNELHWRKKECRANAGATAGLSGEPTVAPRGPADSNRPEGKRHKVPAKLESVAEKSKKRGQTSSY